MRRVALVRAAQATAALTYMDAARAHAARLYFAPNPRRLGHAAPLYTQRRRRANRSPSKAWPRASQIFTSPPSRKTRLSSVVRIRSES